jgi:HlyD family secretion protein
VEPRDETRRLSFNRAGIVGEVPVALGQTVKRDEVLLRLRDDAERAALFEAEATLAVAQAEEAQLLAGVNPAQLRAAEAEFTYARKTAERSTQLRRTAAIADADDDLAQTTLHLREAERERLRDSVRDSDRAVAAAKVVAARARVSAARQQLAETILRAPSDGTVLEILRREGEAVHPTVPVPVAIFGNLTALRVRAEIDETHALALAVGQRVAVTPRAITTSPLRGRVVFLKQMMGPKTVFAQTSTERRDLGTLQVLIDLPAGTTLPVGLEVDVKTFPLDQEHTSVDREIAGRK